MDPSESSKSHAVFAFAPDGHRSTGANPAHRPHAIIYVNDLAFAGVCAWCVDKDEADKWCREKGLKASHTICPTCRASLKNEYEVVRRWWVA